LGISINENALTEYTANNRLKHAALIWLLVVLPAGLIECLDLLQLVDFRFQRALILNGEWWRLVTGHLDHLGWVHFGLNALFLAFVLMIFEPLQRVVFTLGLWLFSVISISVCLLFFSPELIWYVGLSSSLYSLLVIGILLDVRFSLFVRVGAVALVFIKVWFEQGDQLPWVSQIISGPVAEVSHLYGVATGFVLVSIIFCMSRFGVNKI